MTAIVSKNNTKVGGRDAGRATLFGEMFSTSFNYTKKFIRFMMSVQLSLSYNYLHRFPSNSTKRRHQILYVTCCRVTATSKQQKGRVNSTKTNYHPQLLIRSRVFSFQTVDECCSNIT